MREEEQRKQQQKEREAAAKRASAIPTAWDLISPLAAQDGSFGRSYICLKDHEKSCYGRPYVVDVACFNEWATEEVPSSVKSKRGSNLVQARPPYKVGKLELQLLFVPKPKGSKDEDMPKSMNGCIREMQAAEATACRQHEGNLSQQGGDCPVSRNTPSFCHKLTILTTSVLAPPFLQTRRCQIDRLPRIHHATSRHHQPLQSHQTNRRSICTHPKRNHRQRWSSPSFRLRRRRRGLHVCRGGFQDSFW